MLAVAMFALSVILSRAQTTTNNTALAIQGIEAHFNNSGIVPSLLKQFSPAALLTLTYTGVGQIQPGQNLTVDRESFLQPERYCF